MLATTWTGLVTTLPGSGVVLVVFVVLGVVPVVGVLLCELSEPEPDTLAEPVDGVELELELEPELGLEELELGVEDAHWL